ncbi:MAG TPA: pyridoxamine 5'-phosphate oxidase family protein [Anaerolineales bacterium]|nr:pyridoxamine 5'-phosphate oxidase family protein [Anaerolineales bacterium]
MSWSRLEGQAPELAAFGAVRLHNKVAYLATIRKDGSPRVHPFTPIIGEGHFFAFMEPTSPKGHDLRRDGRFAVHCSVSDTSGESGEFFVCGRAKFIEDPKLRALAIRICPYPPAERYLLFEFEPERVTTTEYKEGEAVRQHWKIDEQRNRP